MKPAATHTEADLRRLVGDAKPSEDTMLRVAALVVKHERKVVQPENLDLVVAAEAARTEVGAA